MKSEFNFSSKTQDTCQEHNSKSRKDHKGEGTQLNIASETVVNDFYSSIGAEMITVFLGDVSSVCFILDLTLVKKVIKQTRVFIDDSSLFCRHSYMLLKIMTAVI